MWRRERIQTLSSRRTSGGSPLVSQVATRQKLEHVCQAVSHRVCHTCGGQSAFAQPLTTMPGVSRMPRERAGAPVLGRLMNTPPDWRVTPVRGSAVAWLPKGAEDSRGLIVLVPGETLKP